MGLFGGKKTYVSSVCYNLAGAEAERPSYLKTMVISNIIGANPRSSIADALHNGYMSGPTFKMRGYYRWAEDNYNSVIGLNASGIAGAPDIDPAVVEANLGEAGEVVLQIIRSNPADFEVWAEQWMLINYPSQFKTAWSADYDDTTGDITVTLVDTSEHTFTPANFDKDALYIYASYSLVETTPFGTIITGDVVDLAPGVAFPDTTGWTNEGGGVYSQTEFLGSDGIGRILSKKTTMYQDGSVPGVHSYRIDEQEVDIRAYGTPKVFIYKVGSGVLALDAEVAGTGDVGGFFPPIPVRVDNHFLSSSYLSTQYDAAKQAYKRLTAGGKFDELITKLEDNPDLADIDYVFVVPGVSLNVVENASRRYLYEFFSGAGLTAVYGEAAYDAWVDGVDSSTSAASVWQDWFDAQGDTGNPLNGSAEPPRSSYGSAARNEVRVKTTAASLGYDTRISWKSIKEETIAGLGKVDAKVGEVWLAKGDAASETGPVFGGHLGLISTPDGSSEDLLIYYQRTDSSYKKLTIRGLVHQNYIYKGKYVEIKAHEALDDEDESGFIVPIHNETWRSMSIKNSTQMATASLFLVINSYKVKKQKWYQTGIFKIVLFIVIVIAVVMTFGIEAIAAAPGLLGTAAAVGASLGLTGLMAIIIGVVANALAAMILVKILTVASMAVFGDRIGLIVAMIASFVAIQMISGIQAGLSMAESLTSLSNPMSLLALTNSVGQGVAGVMQMDVQDIVAKTQDVLDSYKDQSRAISELYEQNIGYGRGLLDPTLLTDFGRVYVEGADTFLARTLMTGSDIAELSNTLLTNFTELTLSTELPL